MQIFQANSGIWVHTGLKAVRMSKAFQIRALALGVLFTLSGCLTDQVAEEGTEVDIQPPNPDSYVCNPFSDVVGGNRFQGIHGALSYADPDGPHYETVAEYMDHATPVDVDLFFNQLYVPTRPFDRGFVTQGGTTIKAADGLTTLYEWFAIRFSGLFVLGPQDAAGPYQMAILSDDGSVLDVGDGVGGTRRLIDNDQWHPTRLGCATEPLEMSATSAVPFQLDYFQGPRYHIALIVLWRPWPSAPGDVVDPMCGRQGNSMWFDYTQDPPTPTANYNNLLARGWKVLTPENYLLPGQEDNPCNAPAPVISSPNIVNVTKTSATMTWNTDIPASSQVEIKAVVSGEILVTTPAIALVTSHSVDVSGLTSNTLYEAKAISASSSGLSSESAVITFRTNR